jgi:hypothetical protein
LTPAGAAALGVFRSSAFLLVVSFALAVLARAVWIRRVEASDDGLRFNDGVFGHFLMWSEIDGFVVTPRSMKGTTQPAVQVLHHGRFIDSLPLPSDRWGKEHRPGLQSVASLLVGLRESKEGDLSCGWCPVRIVGGLRGRMGITVAVVDPNGEFDWLIAPEPRLDGLAFILGRSSRRQRAESVRAQKAAAMGCPPMAA